VTGYRVYELVKSRSVLIWQGKSHSVLIGQSKTPRFVIPRKKGKHVYAVTALSAKGESAPLQVQKLSCFLTSDRPTIAVRPFTPLGKRTDKWRPLFVRGRRVKRNPPRGLEKELAEDLRAEGYTDRNRAAGLQRRAQDQHIHRVTFRRRTRVQAKTML